MDPKIVLLVRQVLAEHDPDASILAGDTLALAVLAEADAEKASIIRSYERGIERDRQRLAELRGEDVADACDVAS